MQTRIEERPCEDRKEAIYKPRREASGEPHPADTLASRSVRKEISVFQHLWYSVVFCHRGLSRLTPP